MDAIAVDAFLERVRRAFVDGWKAQASGWSMQCSPARLYGVELAAWREGWQTAERRERA